jgi:hypothetical protein
LSWRVLLLLFLFPRAGFYLSLAGIGLHLRLYSDSPTGSRTAQDLSPFFGLALTALSNRQQGALLSWRVCGMLRSSDIAVDCPPKFHGPALQWTAGHMPITSSGVYM